MYRAVLPHDDLRVDTHYLPARECFRDALHGQGIMVWLSIGRHDDGSIDYQEVGVGGRQAFPIEVNFLWHGKGD